MADLTQKQLHILRHALGLDRMAKPYRNHYRPGAADEEDVMFDLYEAGLVEPSPYDRYGWRVTEAGIAKATVETNADIDTADVVLHTPTGEEWVVAYVKDGKVCCCGWPLTYAPISDCELVRKATAEERQSLMRDMAAMTQPDPRVAWQESDTEFCGARSRITPSGHAGQPLYKIPLDEI